MQATLGTLIPLLLADAGQLSGTLSARWLMGLSLGAHIVLAALGVGMPLLLLFAEGRYLTGGDELWKTLAQRWSKAFAVLFALGAVSGTVLSFELGLLWPGFMDRFGPVIALPFSLEGVAFFLEAIFVGIYLYGWNRLGGWAHWLCGVPIAVSGFASAWFVVSVNAWMNSPHGFRWEDGKAVEIDPIAAMFNPFTWPETAHAIGALYMTTGFMVAAVYAWRLLRDRQSIYNRRAMALGLTLGVLAAPAQFISGDWSARNVAVLQPVKLAAMEGQFATQAFAPLRIGGWPDMEVRETRYAIKIPGMLSWLAFHDRAAVVRGLDDFPPDALPPVPVVHMAFQTMVGIGTLLLLLAAYFVVIGAARRRLPDARWLLWAIVLSGPLAVVAMEAGWIVTEVGRQPWIVHEIVRTADMATASPYVAWALAGTLGVYGLIAMATAAVLLHMAGAPIDSGVSSRAS